MAQFWVLAVVVWVFVHSLVVVVDWCWVVLVTGLNELLKDRTSTSVPLREDFSQYVDRS